MSNINESAQMIPGVVYMPVPRCDQCRFWRLDAGDDYGVCLLSGYGSQVHGPDYDGCIKTLPDFGCVQFKAKGGEDDTR